MDRKKKKAEAARLPPFPSKPDEKRLGFLLPPPPITETRHAEAEKRQRSRFRHPFGREHATRVVALEAARIGGSQAVTQSSVPRRQLIEPVAEANVALLTRLTAHAIAVRVDKEPVAVQRIGPRTLRHEIDVGEAVGLTE